MPQTSTRDPTSALADPETNPTTTTWDRDSEETPVFAVVSAVADATDTDPLALPPLHGVLDPEALNDLFTSRADSGIDTVTFQYCGFDVTVRSSGDVRVRPAADD